MQKRGWTKSRIRDSRGMARAVLLFSRKAASPRFFLRLSRIFDFVQPRFSPSPTAAAAVAAAFAVAAAAAAALAVSRAA